MMVLASLFLFLNFQSYKVQKKNSFSFKVVYGWPFPAYEERSEITRYPLDVVDVFEVDWLNDGLIYNILTCSGIIVAAGLISELGIRRASARLRMSSPDTIVGPPNN
jgi:hypothetical protein